MRVEKVPVSLGGDWGKQQAAVRDSERNSIAEQG